MRISFDLSAHLMVSDKKAGKAEALLTQVVPVPHPSFPQLTSAVTVATTALTNHLQSAIVEFCLINGLSGVNVKVDNKP